MAKTINFNALRRPSLPLVMSDEAQTKITVGAPSEGLVEELQQIAPEMQTALQSENAESIRTIYDLAARLMSCNREGITVTATDLRDVYKLGLEELIFFYQAYMDFIAEITNAKN